MSEEAYPPGSVVLVPFPFTNLSGRKRRPALIVSPPGFREEDLVLCAITSQIPQKPSEWEASLKAEDMVEEKLPKQSIVKAGKLFTMHRELIAGHFGTAKEHKLQEILMKLQALFKHPASRASGPAAATDEKLTADEPTIKIEELDEAVLALLHLNSFKHHGQVRSWKTFDWDAMDRLHEQGFIEDPRSKAKSVPITAEGITASEEAFIRRFT